MADRWMVVARQLAPLSLFLFRYEFARLELKMTLTADLAEQWVTTTVIASR